VVGRAADAIRKDGRHEYSDQNGPGARLVPMKMAQTGFASTLRRCTISAANFNVIKELLA